MHELYERVCTLKEEATSWFLCMIFMRGCLYLKRTQQDGGQNIHILHNFGGQKGSGIRSGLKQKTYVSFKWDFKRWVPWDQGWMIVIVM